MEFIGGDPDAMHRLVADMRAEADVLDDHNRALTAAISSIEWLGNVASRFVGLFGGTFRPRLVSTTTFIRDISRELELHAQEQYAASESQGFTAGALLYSSKIIDVLECPALDNPSSLVHRIESVAEQNAFEIIEVGGNPPRYLVLLPGIEGFDPAGYDTVRDLPAAVQSTLAGRNPYAERVKAELERAGVPAGAELAIVGHSFGAMTAIDLARDESFNSADGSGGRYHVKITHVAGLGADISSKMGGIPPETHAYLGLNRADSVADVIGLAVDIADGPDLGDISKLVAPLHRQAADLLSTAVPGELDGFDDNGSQRIHRFSDLENAGGLKETLSGHHYDNYDDSFERGLSSEFREGFDAQYLGQPGTVRRIEVFDVLPSDRDS